MNLPAFLAQICKFLREFKKIELKTKAQNSLK